MTHGHGCTIGSKSDDKSYVVGTVDADGRSAIVNGGGLTSEDGGGGGGGDGSSKVARCACKYDRSACKFTTCNAHTQFTSQVNGKIKRIFIILARISIANSISPLGKEDECFLVKP